jgi:DNA-binding transcriptional ArsR family regulator
MLRSGTRKPADERRKKEATDAICYAFGHWIRLEALAILAEGKFSVAEMARIIGVGAPRLSGHIRGLYDHGCIEKMETEMSAGTTEQFYRAIVLPHIDDETFRIMEPFERRDSLGLVAQAIFAESLASLRAGKLDDDENARIIGRCLRVDGEGKKEVQAHALEVYEQLVEIKIKNAHRLAKSRKPGTSTIVSVTAFERSRPNMPQTEKLAAARVARGKARKPLGDRKKNVVDAVTYACGNGIRLGALEIFAEGKISVLEVANELGVELKALSDHVQRLFNYGCIQEAGVEKVRNATKHFYRAITLPCVGMEEYQALTIEERRDVIGLVLQRIISSTLASFRSGGLEHDETVQLIWDCLNLDGEGTREVAACLTQADGRLLAIEALNSERLVNANGEGIPVMATLVGFERSRPSRPSAGYGSPRKI